MVHNRAMIFYLFLLLILLSYQACTTTGNGGFSATLIHPFSPLSPFYNPNITKEEQWNAILMHSQDRLRHLESKRQVPTESPIEAPLTPTTTFGYLMNFSIGTPPVPVVAQIDTGSGLTWIQSLPCGSCFPHKYPIFDPSKSSSFHMVTCSNPLCVNVPDTQCESGMCTYSIGYGDGSTTSGNLAFESFTFPAEGGGPSAVEDLVAFGASHRSKGTFKDNIQGLVGLDKSAISLANQLGDARGRFSYYLAPPNTIGRVGHIKFGKTSIFKGNPTPMRRESEDYYYVDLDDISVDDERLYIPPKTFYLNKDTSGGFIIDSGSVITHLKDEGYRLLEAKLIDRITLSRRITKFDGLCFYGTEDDIFGGTLPKLTFHFKGLDVQVPPTSYFRPADDQTICIVIRSSKYSLSIFGSEVQQNLYMGFNIYTQQIYMSP